MLSNSNNSNNNNKDDYDADSDNEDIEEDEEDSVLTTYATLLTEVEVLMTVLETAEAGLAALQRPMEQLALHQLGNVPFLQSSPFRQESFLLKRRIEGNRVPYHVVCAQLRAHCLTLPTEGDELVVSSFLRDMLHIRTRTTTFPRLLGALTEGLV